MTENLGILEHFEVPFYNNFEPFIYLHDIDVNLLNHMAGGQNEVVIIEDLGSHVQNPLCATIKAPGLARQLLLLSDLLVYLLLLNNNFFLA